MKNIYGETVKPQYEVALKQHVKGDIDNDYESVAYHEAYNYKEAVKIAKKFSLDIGCEDSRFKETATLDAGLAQVTIICYYADDTSSYNDVWQEEYINRKKTRRYGKR